jgi:hypothetical protein
VRAYASLAGGYVQINLSLSIVDGASKKATRRSSDRIKILEMEAKFSYSQE